METALTNQDLTSNARFTWNRCAFFTGLSLVVGIALGVWWPLWLLPPHLADTVYIYVAFSQLWLVILLLCLLLRPTGSGKERVLDVIVIAWPFSALLIVGLSGVATVFNYVINNWNVAWWIADGALLVLWLLLSIWPVLALTRLVAAYSRKRFIRRCLIGIAVAVIYVVAIVPHVALASGGILTEPLHCDPPVVLDGQAIYACKQYGMFDYVSTFQLTAAEGSPVGQLQVVPER